MVRRGVRIALALAVCLVLAVGLAGVVSKIGGAYGIEGFTVFSGDGNESNVSEPIVEENSSIIEVVADEAIGMVSAQAEVEEEVSVLAKKKKKEVLSNETLIQGRVMAGQDVKWVKLVTYDTNITNSTIKIHKEGKNVVVSQRGKSDDDEEVLMAVPTLIVGNTIYAGGNWSWFDRVMAWLTSLRMDIFGATVGISAGLMEKNVIVGGVVNFTELQVDYETAATVIVENKANPVSYSVFVSSAVNYTDVIAHTDVPLNAKAKVYRVTEKDEKGKKVKVKTLVNYNYINTSLGHRKIGWKIPELGTADVDGMEFEVNLTILNTQSYPELGGNWTVFFNTTGTADLNITKDAKTHNDLTFEFMKCGEDIVVPQIVNRSYLVNNWNCDGKTAQIEHTVNIGGAHAQYFDFGGIWGVARNDVADAWWNTSWTKRQEIIITENSGDTLTDFQVELPMVTYDTDMNNNFSDIRFTNQTGAVEIDYWLETKTDGVFATYWVEVPSLTALANTTIYMYYGNSDALNTSNDTATFIFHDDFEDGDISDWTVVASDPTADNTQSVSGSWSMYVDGNDGASSPRFSATGEFFWEYQYRYTLESAGGKYFYQSMYDGGGYGGFLSTRTYSPGNPKLVYYDGAYKIFYDSTNNVWYDMQMIINITPAAGDYYDIYLDSDLKVDNAAFSTDKAEITYVQYQSNVNYQEPSFIDDVFIRKSATPMPTVPEVGDEEEQGGADETNPLWGTNVTNCTSLNLYVNTVCQFNITLTDETGASMELFENSMAGLGAANDSAGTWLNNSVLTDTKTVTATRAQTISWQWFFNDSSDNWNSTDQWELTVLNTLPSNVAPTLTPSDAPLNTTYADLACGNITSDADGDTVVNFYQWYKDDVLVPGVANATTVTSGNTSIGEKWICEVTPNDGTGNGTALNSSSLTISDDDTHDDLYPSNAIGSDDMIHVVFQRADYNYLSIPPATVTTFFQDNWVIAYMNSSDNGTTWNDAVNISGPWDEINDGGAGGGRTNQVDLFPDIDIDSSGNLHVAWQRYNTTKGVCTNAWMIFYANSTNNGSTWSTPEAIRPTGFVGSDLPCNYWDDINPSINIDANDVVHVVWQANNESSGFLQLQGAYTYTAEAQPMTQYHWKIFYTNLTTVPGSTTWVTVGDNACSDTENDRCMFPDVDTTSTQIHVAWQNSTMPAIGVVNNHIAYSNCSDLTGSSFTAAPDLLCSATFSDGCGFPKIDVDSQNKLHLAGQRAQQDAGPPFETHYFIMYSNSSTNGAAWQAMANITNNVTTETSLPVITADYSDYVYVNWYDDRLAESDIWHRNMSDSYVWNTSINFSLDTANDKRAYADARSPTAVDSTNRTFFFSPWHELNDSLADFNIVVNGTADVTVVEEDVDSTPPTYSANATNATVLTTKYDIIEWNATIADETALQYYWLATNDTGLYANETANTIGGTPTDANVSDSINVTNAGGGNTLCGKIYFNDTSGNENVTAEMCFVMGQYIAVALSSDASTIAFGSISQNTNDNNGSANYNASDQTTYWATLSAESSINADFCIKANAALTISGGSTTIPLTGYTWDDNALNNAAVPVLPGAALTIGYVKGTANLVPGGKNYYRFWLDVPNDQAAGTYNNTVYFKVVETGNPC